ncbi:MAG TPA: RiPP maturation radical SAM C-methyltransferase [Pyrinomonadaceae bacterium]|nr:RiPP maturation radical SAM C-methyltransferase [Pyrinomonadaceae bacterium]
MREPKAILVAMPWALLNRPSIQLGVLQSVLQEQSIKTEVRSFFLHFMEYLAEKTANLSDGKKIVAEHYVEIAAQYFIGDWIFAVPPFHDARKLDNEYFAYVRSQNVSEELISLAIRMRELVPGFLDYCVKDLLRARPAVVGFTTTFGQNIPSLVLSKLLKQKHPSLKIVFGGANCDGPMGEALHHNFPWIDVVVRGEGESVIAGLMADLFSGRPVTRHPGLCVREGKRKFAIEQSSENVRSISAVPFPNYDEYFDQIGKLSFGSEILRDISIPFEGSRGCWWGAKQHCTFCGLNGSAMAFRSKSADRAVDELLFLAKKYQQLSFQAVDNIMDMRYFSEFLPKLRDSDLDLRIFYEVKSNLKRWQVRLLRDAGVAYIQPGIESLSTPILRLMKKGVTALQNIRLLKWCLEFGIHVYWNVIYGFPGEPPEEYDRMADLMRSVEHLQPPNLIRLGIERFSPYHQRPQNYNLEIVGPRPYYRFAYPCDERALSELAYSFDYRYKDGQQPEAYINAITQRIEHWQSNYDEGSLALQYSRGPGFLIINDRRPALEFADYHLAEEEARIYLACDSGATPKAIWESLKKDGGVTSTIEDVEDYLKELHKASLVYEEDGVYLSLAVPVNSRRRVPDPK